MTAAVVERALDTDGVKGREPAPQLKSVMP